MKINVIIRFDDEQVADYENTLPDNYFNERGVRWFLTGMMFDMVQNLHLEDVGEPLEGGLEPADVPPPTDADAPADPDPDFASLDKKDMN